MRKNIKYIAIIDGDLDLNNAYGINSDIELESFITACKKDRSRNKIQAIFKVEYECI